MIKRFILLAVSIIVLAGKSYAETPTYTGNLIDAAVCIDSTTPLDLNSNHIDYLSFQTIYSSGVYVASTFTDGRSSTASITVASNSNFTIRAATNSITISSTASLAPVKATDKITIASYTALGGAVLTVNGIQLIEGRDWSKQSTATGTAVALKNLLLTFPGITASTASNVIFTTATSAGLGGNAFTMTSSTPAAMTVLSTNFTGGRENGLTNAVLTVNGVTYLNGYLWTSLDSAGLDNSTMTATSLASLLNHLTGISAEAISSVVTATATTSGTAGNSFTMSSSTSAMTVASANFSGGRATTTVTINGTVLTNGVDWTTGSTSSATAKSISDAIAANSSLHSLITSTWNASAVITATSTATGASANYLLSTNNSTSITLPPAFAGGSTAAWIINTPTITVTNHGYALGVGVLYTTGTVAIGGLSASTTYYVIPITANTIKLASSRANAAAGTFITLTSSSSTGQHTYTLTPIGLSGSASWKWQQSNDNTNWVDMSVSSASFLTPFTSSSAFWDFGNINPHYIRLNFAAPTTGCVNLKAAGNGKSAP